MRSALVTGATGFVGSHLVEALRREGVTVTCLVRPTSDTWELVKMGASIVTMPLPGSSVEELATVVTRHDVVFHLAGAVRALSLEGFRRVNAQLVEDLATACLRATAPPERFILMSSLAAVGPPPEGAVLTEAQEPAPVTDYGRSKLEGERRVASLAAKLPVVIVRPTGVYGPRDRELLPMVRLAARGLVPLLGGRDQVLNLVHVADVVEATLLAASCEVPPGEAIHVGDLRNYPMTEVGEILCGLFGGRPRFVSVPESLLTVGAVGAELVARVRRRPAMLTRQKLPELRASWPLDLTRARQLLGYEPRFSLEEGLRDTVAWYRQEGLLSPEGRT